MTDARTDAKLRGRATTIRRLVEDTRELEELRTVFDLTRAADLRAIKMWQASTGRELTWPDRADLTLWLLTRLAEAEGVINAARPLGKLRINVDDPFTERHKIGLDVSLHVAAYDQLYPLPVFPPKDESMTDRPNGACSLPKCDRDHIAEIVGRCVATRIKKILEVGAEGWDGTITTAAGPTFRIRVDRIDKADES